MVKLLARTGRQIADFLWPPQCLACRAAVAEPRSLCADCWGQAVFLEPPLCGQCGFPFDFDTGETLCAACLARPPAFSTARAVMRYDAVARKLVGALKYGDRQEGTPAFAKWLHRAGRDVVAQCDCILPVPLHPKKLFERRFNQSALLAQGLARLSGRPCLLDGLTRTRYTDSQAGLGQKARRDNVKNAFALNTRHTARLTGARVLLVDDVFTTGATLDACARALLAGGAAEASALVLARVVEPRQA